MTTQEKDNKELILGLVSVLDGNPPLEYDDKTVVAIHKRLKELIASPFKVHRRTVPNTEFNIERALRELIDIIGCDLVLTAGGIGPGRNDHTARVTRLVANRTLPGLSNEVCSIARKLSADSIFMTFTAALRDTPERTALIVNLPNNSDALKILEGSPETKGILPLCSRCLELIAGPTISFLTEKNSDEEKNTDKEQVENLTTVPEMSVSSEIPPQDNLPSFEPEDILTATPKRLLGEPDATVIWLHGMGVDNRDFETFPDEILRAGGPSCRFILPNAPVREISAHPGYPLRAWYDVLTERFDCNEDKAGITETALKISHLIADLEKLGIPRSKIFLGGFSQGAAMALHTGLREKTAIGGILALSGYLPLAGELFSEITEAGRKTPVFMAHGNYDSVISPLVAKRSAEVISELNPYFYWRDFNMDHEICAPELTEIARFMNTFALDA